MLFSSATFLCLYLPATLLIYYITPRRFRNAALLALNLVFYGWGEPKYIILMLACAYVNQFASLMMVKRPQHRRAWLVFALVLSLGGLFYFKYAAFFADALGLPIAIETRLPLGISFYTFQALSYSVDVYRMEVPAQKSPVRLGLYISLFPQLIAGPIVRYADVANQIDERRESVAGLASGARRFILGFAKKLLLANAFGKMWTLLSPLAEACGAPVAWLGAAAFSMQIYFDFSGYSDMAIGLGRMFGFEFMENFNFPYISRSITEFWRRWHISLSTWFRDYVYIPLGGSRAGHGRTIFNLLVVWLLTGLWHGASWNFVIWGLFYFTLLTIEKLGLKKLLDSAGPVLPRIYALFFIMFGWMIFNFTDLGDALTYARAMLSPAQNMNDNLWLVLRCLPFMLLGGLLSTPLGAKLVKKTGDIGLAAIFILSVAAMISDSYNPFLYFRF